MDIGSRKLAILATIIDDYISTGIPVGSRTISKKPGMDISSATIRNEMADLEELGFLEQPHTSAGRVPSDRAYRLYVDRLMQTQPISNEEAVIIKKHYDSHIGMLEDVIEQTAKALSDATDQIAMVLTPQLNHIEIKRIQLVKITESKVLLLVITNTGLVREVCLNVNMNISQHNLDILSNMLTKLAYNKRLSEANLYAIDPILEEFRLKREFLDSIIGSIQSSTSQKKNVILTGTKNIFNYPEYKDVERAKKFLQVLETQDMLEQLLSKAKNLEFTINIGQENEFDELKDLSVVTATYKIGGVSVGSFGVIGPTRMDYPKVLAILNYVGNSLNAILSSFIEDK